MRSGKKREMRDMDRVVEQFDKLATSFQKTKGAESGVMRKVGIGEAKVETAGMLKKRTKVKKEKSLSAKLRLKTKKGGDGKK